MKIFAAMALISMLVINTPYAGEADVLTVEVNPTGPDTFQFSVTVRHDDKGWDH